MVSGPKEAVIRLTDSCNARCKICGIWEGLKKQELDKSCLKRLPKSLNSIGLSGGEPFLRDDLAEVVDIIKSSSPKSRIVISTNGILTEVIEKQVIRIMKINPRTALRVSLDGIESIHDEARGIKNAYQKAINTLKVLKKLGVKDLGVTITVSDFNVNEIIKVYNLSRNKNIKFNCQIAHSSEFYYQKNNQKISKKDILKKQLNELILSELKNTKIRSFFLAYYHRGLWDYANEAKRSYPCCAGSLFFYLSQNGDIYPCIFSNEAMGNLLDNDFDYIWQGSAANQIRERVKKCNRNCWTVCTVAPVIKNYPLKAASWIFANKFRHFLGNADFIK